MFNPRYRLTHYLSENLEKTALLASALNRLSSKSPLRIRVTREALSRDIHSSTWIEGNQLSLAEVTAILNGKDVVADVRQKAEVKNCIQALRWIMAHKQDSLIARQILALHARMTKGLLPSDRSGRWRKVQNYVVNARRQVVFTPPLPNEVPGRMQDLLKWVSEAATEHAVVRSAIFHHEFLAIHPFTDGNGRMARALSQWILLKGSYDPAHSLGLDEFFADDRAKYYQMIQETHDMDGDYTHWIEYFAQGLFKSMEKLSEKLSSVKLDGRLWTPKQRELLDLLKKRGVLGSGEICQVMDINRARVNQLIAPLVAAGMVIKEGRTRSARYRAV